MKEELSTSVIDRLNEEYFSRLCDVTGEFCTDSSQEGQLGLMDEAIKDAQSKSGADFITNVTFYSTGSCVMLEGTGQKLVKATK